MAKGAKGLKTLIRLSKFNVDEKRRTLTALQAREDQILDAIRRAEALLVHEQQAAAADPGGVGFAFPAFFKAWTAQREQLQQSLSAVRGEIEVARDELAEAFREQKTYEVTKEQRDKREREELDRKEQAFLDEVGQNTHLRRKAEDEV
ncbi:MAG TPA: flagellar export protein FliJ [Magnetospirillum sp.]|jgi:flagellar export protein FliJ|nr:flagellar export protein FliJ [Magnetospirillum sp.]